MIDRYVVPNAMATDPLRVLALPADNFACGQWRTIKPYSTMRDARIAARVQVGGGVAGDTFDLAVFGRPTWSKHLELFRFIKESGKKLVVDFDDPFPLSDPRHRDFSFYAPVDAEHMRRVMQLADAVTVPTPQLVRHYQQMHSRVVCLPNAIDVDGPSFVRGPADRLSEKLTIFWSGWKSHDRNLRMIEPAVSRLLFERDDAVLAICGPADCAELFRRHAPSEKVRYIDPAPFEAFMRIASIADIALAPLEPTEFNDHKSENRLLEAGVWRVPAVASPVAAYRRFEGGQGACLLADGPDQWYEQLRRLLEDASLRRETGRRARLAVESRYALGNVNRARADLLCSLVAI